MTEATAIRETFGDPDPDGREPGGESGVGKSTTPAQGGDASPHAGQTDGIGDPLGLSPDLANIPDTEATAKIFEEMASADPQGAATLQRQWGGDAARNIAFARGAAKQLASEELVALLNNAEINGVPVGSHPAFVQAAASVGRLLARTPGDPASIAQEAPRLHGPGSGVAGETAITQNRLDELHELQFSDPEKYRSAKVQNELNRLYDRLYGGGSIVGHDGRTV